MSSTTLVSSSDERARGARYLLVIGDDRMVTLPLVPGGAIVLGRDADCDVTLAHGKVSRRHARVTLEGETAVIEDLGSTNGLRVAGVKLASGERAPLPVGEAVRLGPYTAIVLSGGVDPQPSADGLPRAGLTITDPTLAGKDDLLARIAQHGVNVLIQGETGTGKDVLARTLHQLSGRPGELVAINCAALSGPLLESELFGHERGAFTGATRTKPGLLEVAGRGTALLDEIGDLPLELQGKLLRALESRQVYRVGGVAPIDLHARVIAATHRRLTEEVARGAFRQDLFFRLNGITLEVAPLRARRSRISALATELLGGAANRLGASALQALHAHDWPGNVRELKQVLERALLLAGDGPITSAHVLLAPARPDDERQRFLAVARSHRGNVTLMARDLATSRSHVRRLAERFGIDLQALRE